VVAGIAVATTFLLVASPPVGGQIPESIDLTADVEATNCAPCHLQLGESTKPGLIFSHGNHLMVSCTGCHYRPAHEGSQLFTPPMETCYNCHGVEHGPAGELATAECTACHPPSYEFRPDGHVEDWAEKPHAESARAGTNRCVMCHDAPADCDECHDELGLDIPPVPNTYIGRLLEKPMKPAVTVYPTEPTSMGQCIYCHPDIDDFLPGRIIFAHADHLRRNYQCTVCHPQFGHGVEEIKRPDMMSCYRCHGASHAAAGLIATEDCLACHPKDFELKPSDHTKKFERGEHKKRASKEQEYCGMCHKPEFCVECHMGRRKSGPGSELVIPVDHKRVEWLSSHGKLFLQQEGACGSCHDSKSCTVCHKTVMPHPADWLKNHADEAEEDPEDCRVCHTDRNSCQNCHHDAVKRSELIAENCVPCHDQMKQEPATEIPHKGFAEHAVHFGVEEVKGKPYKCYDCHVTFGSSAAAQQIAKLQGHDLRLCYDCHGSLDVYDRQIAPYPGASLCRRCHAGVI